MHEPAPEDQPSTRSAPDDPDARDESPLDAVQEAALSRYWASNIRVMLALLFVWAVVGLGCGVLWADALSDIMLGGFPLGFWFAQQGSIIIFVLLILAYAIILNRLDARYHREVEEGRRAREGGVAS